jgi:hypothetical protein
VFARLTLILTLVSLSPAAAFLSPTARAQGILRDGFEGPETALRAAGGDGKHRVDAHQRVETNPHSGRRCEHLRITGGGATAIYFAYPIRPARVIGELSVGLWLRSDRPGLQVVARVVLPRSLHPQTGEPLTTLVRGADLRQAGAWQLLRVENLPRAIELQVRVLRSQFGPQVDAREAYVDQVLVNVYGGQGTTSVWFDDLEITGAIEPAGVAGIRAEESGIALTSGTSLTPLPSVSNLPEVEFKRQLTVGGEPFFPRIIEHRGEPLAKLQELGFNCVRLERPASGELLAEAARLRMWLIAPPPPLEELKRAPGGPQNSGAAPAISPAYDAVLAWDMGSGLTARELDLTRAWASAVQQADGRGRPILCGAIGDLKNYTRPPFKIFLAERDLLGTTLELERFDNWLAERTQIASAGAPMWVTVPTQASPELVEQMRLVSGMQIPPPVWQESQIRSLVHLALAGRARGICFTSHSRLDAEDSATRMRALALELINLELTLIERWPAAGNFSAMAETSDPGATTGAVIDTEYSRLMLPIYQPRGAQYASGSPAAAQVSFTIAGVPEGDDAYELSLTALRPLRSMRRPGGMFITLGDRSRDSLVVFTRDPRVIRNLKNGLEKSQRRALHLSRALAAAQLAEFDAVSARLPLSTASRKFGTEARVAVVTDLAEADKLAATDITRAYDESRHALQILRQLERVSWEQVTQGATPLADPLLSTVAALPYRESLQRRLAASPLTLNRLPEGGCENLAAMMAAGWKHYQHPQPAIQTSVDLVPTAAHSGTVGLLLRAAPADEKLTPSAVESPAVWVTTAPIAVETGDLVQIEAWVRIDSPIASSVDGLVMLDSHSGEALAMRLHKTAGWRQVTLYRAATQPGPFAVTFALAGLGAAAIDDVTLKIVQRAATAGPVAPGAFGPPAAAAPGDPAMAVPGTSAPAASAPGAANPFLPRGTVPAQQAQR